MNGIEIVQKLASGGNRFRKVIMAAPVKTLKSAYVGNPPVAPTVVKHSFFYAMAGADYGAMKLRREGAEVGALPAWQAWQLEPYLLVNPKSGEEYVRLFPPTDAQAEAFNMERQEYFTIDGKQASEAAARALCGSAIPDNDNDDDEKRLAYVISPKTANIVSIE